MLMRAFKDLTISQVNVLMAPFKAQQLLSHILLSMTYEQIDRTNKFLEEVFYGRKDFDELLEMIDKDLEKGGAGWDKRLAKNFTREVAEKVNLVKTINFDQLENSGKTICSYMEKKFDLKLQPHLKKKMQEIFELRLRNKFDVTKVFGALDLPPEQGGLGLDKRTAGKVARELEILLLIRYGNKSQYQQQ